MTMKKKLICMVLTIIMLLPTTIAFASGKKAPFDPSTEITKDNVYEIMQYYGLDASALRTDITVSTTKKATVGDLEKVIKEAPKLPKTVIINDDEPQAISTVGNVSGIVSSMTTGTATANKDVAITSSCTVNYAATGTYYKSSTVKYWTGAGGAAISVLPTNSVYWYQIDKINSLANTCVNPSTTNSYLHMTYDYIVGCYFGIKGLGAIKINSFQVSGFTNFGTSYIP